MSTLYTLVSSTTGYSQLHDTPVTVTDSALTVDGIVNATDGNSTQWNTTFSTVNTNSADWTWVADNSANNYSFSTIAVNSPSDSGDLVADSNIDVLTLSAGPNIDILTDPDTDRISLSARGSTGGSGEANEFSFKTIGVSGTRTGADIVADTTTDTLILCAGANIEFISDPGTDTITISSRDLADVTGEANEYSFKTIGVSGTRTGADIVADTTTDTFTLCAGPNIEFIADPSTDTLTISAVGGTGTEDTDTVQDLTEVSSSSGKWNETATNSGVDVSFYVANDGTDHFVITQDGLSAENDPALHLQRGLFYRFRINATGNPFWIKTATGTGAGDQFNRGVTNNGTDSGDIDFIVPHSCPRTLYYQCENHTNMVGVINIVDNTAGTTLAAGSGDWDSVYANVNTTSADWESTHTTVSDTSASWANQNAFNTISVDGQNDIIADTTTDTLSVIAGNNVTITTTDGNDTITIASTDTNTTYSAGSGLELYGTEFSHEDTSSASSINGSGQNFIQDIIIDEFGHITSMTAAEAAGGSSFDATDLQSNSGNWDNTYTTVNSNSANWDSTNKTNWDNTYTTVNSNSAANWNNQNAFNTISVDGQNDIIADTTTDTLSVIAGNNVTITTTDGNDTITIASTDTNTTYSAGSGLELYGTEFSHEDTSSASSVNNSGQNFIQDITLDTFGHITAITSAEATGGGGSSFDATDLQANSGNWDNTYTTVKDTSSSWANQNAFNTVASPGQDDVVADTTTDTLSVIGGSNVTVTTNAGADQITIASTDTNTTYTAGQGLDLASTTFSAPFWSTVNSNSANWDSTNRANWDSTYTTVNSNSATWDGKITNFTLAGDGGANQTISDGNTLTIEGGDGITTTGAATDKVTVAVDAALTTVTSILATDLKLGEDDQTKIDFGTPNEIHFYADNTHQIKLIDNALTPQADSDVDLGATGTYWKDAYIDTITTTGKVTVGDGVTVTDQVSATNGFVSGIEDLGTQTSNAVLSALMTGPALQKIVLKANVTNTWLGYNLERGKTVTVRMSACGADRTLTFNDTMLFVGGKPSSLASGKVGLLSITTYGSLCAKNGDTDVIATYAVED